MSEQDNKEKVHFSVGASWGFVKKIIFERGLNYRPLVFAK